MGWQEELRRLDAELAEGSITHEQHRRLRDELLAAASGGGTASPVAQPLHRINFDGPWRSTNPGLAPQPTQEPPPVESTSAALLASGRPTTAPSPADDRPTEILRYPRPFPPPAAARPPLGPPPPGFHHPAGPRPYPAPGGPPSPQNRTKPTWLFLALGVLLVLALVVGATWWLSNGTNAPDGGGPGEAQAAAPKRPDLESRLPALPGAADANSSIMSVEKGAELDLYPIQAVPVFQQHGATEVAYRGAHDSEDHGYFVLAMPTSSPADARQVVDYLFRGALSGGFTAEADGATVTGTKRDRRMRGTWYASGAVAVTIWVSQPSTEDETVLRERFDNTVTALRNALPAQ
ncbi:hypothetical protein SAMN05421810_103753 [Amycolatopsis arida]|uniref:Uncharacterized protein n=1 Tax=Amycolatopsis arida TaxID=587909 RepID=A0A1I5U0N1_9PSEU|nr:hypothetical protein [Amycolatopsis arida]TDX95872.1 hypothetical protein CLV69_1034 [Amycolatopsis arida]SFP88829.1 hypothetical protein SAMN05421810_103753 [Amycolatopsis arida]